jgi:hypothetical protein
MPGSILPLYIAFAWMGLVVVRGRATTSELVPTTLDAKIEN